jgi:hypothetical protein
MKRNMQLFFCTLLASVVTFVACGGGRLTTLPPINIPGIVTKHVTVSNTAHGGSHLSVNTARATMAAMFFQTASPTVYSETWEGYCDTMPIPDPSIGLEVVLNQTGVFGKGDCYAEYHGDPIDDQTPTATGAGTLQHLVVNAVPDGPVAADSGVAKVYVNGTFTGITCTIGTGVKCVTPDSLSFAVSDNDKVVIKFLETGGTHYKFVHAHLAKLS